MVAIPGETSQRKRTPRPGAKVGQDTTPSATFFSMEEDSWGQQKKTVLPFSVPLLPCILRVITKCNLVWGAEGFLSTSA